MRVVLDGYAWLDKSELSYAQIVGLKKNLTVTPRKVGDHPGDAPKPIEVFRDEPDRFGVPRAYFLARQRQRNEVVDATTRGVPLPSPLRFMGEPREEQAAAGREFVRAFEQGAYGGVLQAPTGWGKTTWTAWLIAELGVPALVVVHKDILLEQWRDELKVWLPDVEVGIVRGDQIDIEGRHVAIGMLQTLSNRVADGRLAERLKTWPGLLIADEVHRMGARKWGPVPGAFPARYRVGLSAKPSRKDRADPVFFNHIGDVLFQGRKLLLIPKVRRVWTDWSLEDDDQKKNLTSEQLILRFLVASWSRNKTIVDQVIQAVRAKRHIVVMSHRVVHLERMQKIFRQSWKDEWGEEPNTSLFTGPIRKKMSKEEEAEALRQCVIWTTYKLFEDAVNVPSLDTFVMATPLSDVEQPVGRILRPHKDKKEPIIVDIRDPNVSIFRKKARSRDRFYKTKFGLDLPPKP